MKQSAAEILREYGPFPGVDHVHGVTFDGQHVWFASGDKLNALDPASGKMLRSIDVAAHAGTAFDGRAPVSARRGSHPEDRSEDRPRARHDPGARRRRRLRARLGRRHALGRAVSRPQDPPDRSARPARSFAPSSPTASSPASPGSTASSGTAPGKATRAICAASIRERARSWSGSRCRPAWACRGSSPMAATSSSAAAETAGRCEPSAGRSGAKRRATERRLGRVLHETQQPLGGCGLRRRLDQPTGYQRDGPSPGQGLDPPVGKNHQNLLEVGRDGQLGINVSIRLHMPRIGHRRRERAIGRPRILLARPGALSRRCARSMTA